MKIPLRYVCEMVCDRVAASQIYLGDKYTDASPWEYYLRVHEVPAGLRKGLLKKQNAPGCSVSGGILSRRHKP